MQHGEPVTVPSWSVGGNPFPEAHHIPWLSNPFDRPREIIVCPDDEVESA
jgi:hypothetical protein